jgi:hypothetical protein
MNHTKNVILAFTLLLAGCATTTPTVVELPRPNSGQFTFAQAEARKSEVYSLAQSGMKPNWENPYMGFSVHITRDDEILVYGGTFNSTRSSKMSLSELDSVLASHPQFGNPLGVLVTCERDPLLSPTFSRVIELLFKPSVQIFYYKRA